MWAHLFAVSTALLSISTAVEAVNAAAGSVQGTAAAAPVAQQKCVALPPNTSNKGSMVDWAGRRCSPDGNKCQTTVEPIAANHCAAGQFATASSTCRRGAWTTPEERCCECESCDDWNKTIYQTGITGWRVHCNLNIKDHDLGELAHGDAWNISACAALCDSQKCTERGDPLCCQGFTFVAYKEGCSDPNWSIRKACWLKTGLAWGTALELSDALPSGPWSGCVVTVSAVLPRLDWCMQDTNCREAKADADMAKAWSIAALAVSAVFGVLGFATTLVQLWCSQAPLEVTNTGRVRPRRRRCPRLLQGVLPAGCLGSGSDDDDGPSDPQPLLIRIEQSGGIVKAQGPDVPANLARQPLLVEMHRPPPSWEASSHGRPAGGGPPTPTPADQQAGREHAWCE